jgi:hypothetical protein
LPDWIGDGDGQRAIFEFQSNRVVFQTVTGSVFPRRQSRLLPATSAESPAAASGTGGNDLISWFMFYALALGD